MNPVGARVKSGCCAVLVAVAAVVRAQLGEYTEAGADEAGGGLEVTIPGVPGEDYPIYPAVPDTGFACDGLVEGGEYCCGLQYSQVDNALCGAGYYADPAAECQAFHICGKYSIAANKSDLLLLLRSE